MQPKYVLDGERFDTLEEFYAQVGQVFVKGELWGENLETLNILLHGGIRQIPGIVSAGLETRQAITTLTLR